jgi:NADP-dependent 3-hydroxy acid dehydrogenase YdfG
VLSRLLVVGASSGIGRALARHALDAGADVALVGRRPDRLAEAAGDRGHPIVGDVSEAADCARVVAESTDILGGLDALVYASGSAPLVSLAETTASQWDAVLRTNIVGASLVTAAAIPHLAAANGCVAYLSSDSVAAPKPGLGAYATTKAALDTLLDAWRAECPDVSFLRVVVGPTLTEFASGWDPQRFRDYFARWQEAGLGITAPPMTAADVAAQIWVALTSPSPPRVLVPSAG